MNERSKENYTRRKRHKKEIRIRKGGRRIII